MKFRPDSEALGWMAAGAAALLAVTLLVAKFHDPEHAADQAASKADRVAAVAQMRLSLASAAEAEKSAVLAITDNESQTFANQARALTAQAERERDGLAQLLQANGTQHERDLLATFNEALVEFERVDSELLALAVRNTNLKAYGLAFGPGADALMEMDTALAHLLASRAGSPDAQSIAVLVFGAQTAALRIQTMLAPHIAEESDAKMDALEAGMEAEDQQVRKDLDGLVALEKPGSDRDLDAAIASYGRFSALRTQILALSRENTNVRSLAISLTQKRKVALKCQDALMSLQEAITAEPIGGRAPSSPR